MRPWFRLIAILAVVWGVVFSGGPAWGVVKSLKLERLSQTAEMIVLGRVAGTRAFFSQDGSLILTEALVSVERCLKGATVKEIRVTAIGGRLPEKDIGLWVPDEPTFQPGESALLFLERDSEGGWRVSGGFQGKFNLVQGRDGWLARRSDLADQPLAQVLHQVEGLIGPR